MANPSIPIVPDATFASRPYDSRLFSRQTQELPSEEVTDRLSELVAGAVAGYLEFTGRGTTHISLIKPKNTPLQ